MRSRLAASWSFLALFLAPGAASAGQAATVPTGQQAANESTAQQSDKLAGLDQFIEDVIKEYKVPGLAVAAIEDGKIVHIKGYGFRDVQKQLPVTPQTLFAIGSISKSFTA